MAKVAIMGFGTVGSGVYEILEQNSDRMTKTALEDVEVKYILDIRDFDDHPRKDLFTKDFNDILNDDEVTVVAEVMGGLHPAYEFTKSLLEAGKSVVTSNKELVATYGTELLKTAADNNANYMFEASVGGGIPIIRPLSQCLSANNIQRIAGILNGTTNYILYEMIKHGKTFEAALKQAQNNGYAERNPAADIEGHDACRKIAILASLVSGTEVDYNSIDTEGIVNVTLDDVRYAEKFDSVIKLIGYAEFADGKVYSIVAPMVIKNGNPLAGVDDVFNAVMVEGDCVGRVMFYGPGAGKLPTASAVVADIADSVRHRVRCRKTSWLAPQENIMAGRDAKKFSYFIRTTDSAENVRKAFGSCEFVDNIVKNESAFITAPYTATEIEERVKGISDTITCIRVLEG